MQNVLIEKLEELPEKTGVESYRSYVRRFNQKQESFIQDAVNLSRWELLRHCIVQIMFRLELPFDFVYRMLYVSMPKEKKAALKNEVYSWVVAMKAGCFQAYMRTIRAFMENTEYSFEETMGLFRIPEWDIPYIEHGLTLEDKAELEAYEYQFGRDKLDYIEKKMELDVIPIDEGGLENDGKKFAEAMCAGEADGAPEE